MCYTDTLPAPPSLVSVHVEGDDSLLVEIVPPPAAVDVNIITHYNAFTYVAITNGDCLTHGYEYVKTQSECQVAGLHFGTFTNSVPSTREWRPKYCCTHSGLYGWIHFNWKTSGKIDVTR